MSFDNFISVFPEIILLLCNHFYWLGWSGETTESEPDTFRIMNIPKKPQVALLSSLNIEVRPIVQFHLLRLRHSWSIIYKHRAFMAGVLKHLKGRGLLSTQ